LQWKTNIKSYVASRMAPLLVTFVDREIHVFDWNIYISHTSEMKHMICLHMNQTAHVAG